MGARAVFAAPKRRKYDRSGNLCHPRSLDTSTRVAAREFIPGTARHQDGNLRWADEGWEAATLLTWTEVVRFLHKRILILAAFSLSHSH